MDEKQPTTQEILDAVRQGFNDVDKRFDGVDKRFDGVDKRFDGVDKRFDGIEKRLTKVEATMVTKDYLDDKLGDLKGDMTILMRKEDTKLKALIEILKIRKVITATDQENILAMDPFPDIRLKFGKTN
jgi:predicted  nucleic acid-binding Zn-ribbon protein